jgi:hypothetical protein
VEAGATVLDLNDPTGRLLVEQVASPLFHISKELLSSERTGSDVPGSVAVVIRLRGSMGRKFEHSKQKADARKTHQKKARNE